MLYAVNNAYTYLCALLPFLFVCFCFGSSTTASEVCDVSGEWFACATSINEWFYDILATFVAFQWRILLAIKIPRVLFCIEFEWIISSECFWKWPMTLLLFLFLFQSVQVAYDKWTDYFLLRKFNDDVSSILNLKKKCSRRFAVKQPTWKITKLLTYRNISEKHFTKNTIGKWDSILNFINEDNEKPKSNKYR